MIFCIFLLLAVATVCVLYRILSKQERARRQAEHLFSQKDDSQEDRLRAKRISGYRHDLANHLRTIETLPPDAGRQEILQALFLIKQDTCRENSTRLISKTRPGSMEMLAQAADITELVSLLSNLLDNAIEAVLEIPDPALRTITVSVGETESGLLLAVENPYERVPDFLTKKDHPELHGMGFPIIREITERKGGSMTIDTADGVCRIACLFPLAGKL